MRNIMKDFRLDNKIAIITGGNRGIGKALSCALAQAGAKVAIVDINIKKDFIEKELQDAGAEYIFIKADVTDPKQCLDAVTTVVNTWGKVDILVNNAGACHNKPAEEITTDEWLKIVNLNLNSVFYMSQAAGREMIKAKDGVIVNTSSMSAQVVNYPQPQCSYNATKAGVSQLTKSLAYEWAQHNIRVNAIAPGYIETELTKLGMDTEWGKIWEDLTPMKRVGQPEELGGLIVYLASPASSYMTGSIVTIDGGYTVI